jgi:DNA-binding NarL/FixJ family response regulator
VVVHRVRAGIDVIAACRAVDADLVVLDLQIGNMGGIAACMAVRHEQEAGRIDEQMSVLMLLDRTPDVFLARRSGADGWLVKPLDAFRLRRAATTVLAGGTWFEGVPDDETSTDAATADADATPVGVGAEDPAT